MSLTRTQRGLWSEIEASINQQKPHATTLRLEELATCGVDYGPNRDSVASVPTEPENHRQNWLRMFLPEVAQGVPQAVIGANGDAWPIDRAALIENGVNQCASQSSMRAFVHRTAVDFSFRSARAVAVLRPQPGREGDAKAPMLPTAQRLSFEDYLCDSTVSERTEGRWEAHRVVCDIDSVIDEAERDKSLGWDLEALKQVKDRLGRDLRGEKRQPSPVTRRELVYWCMWEKGLQPPGKSQKEGYFGTVHYVLDGSIAMPRQKQDELVLKGATVRESEAWMGHWEGPYCYEGAYKIGDLKEPLSPLVGSAPQANFVNEIARMILVGMRNYKRNSATMDEGDSALLRSANNGDIITMKSRGLDIRALAATLESGGITEQMLAGFAYAMESLRRNSGAYQSREGNISAEATATAILDAQAGFNTTIGYYGDSYRNFLRQLYARWAFWIDASKDVEMRLGPLSDEVRAALSERRKQEVGRFITVTGGFEAGGPWSIFDHASLDLRIDPFSARQKNEATMALDVQVMSQAIGFLVGLGPAALSVDIDAYMRAVARSRGMKEAERILDSNRLRAILAMSIGQPQAAQSKPQPTAPRNVAVAFSGSRPVSTYGAMEPRRMPGQPQNGQPKKPKAMAGVGEMR